MIIIVLAILCAFILLKLLSRLLAKQEQISGPKIHIKFAYNVMRLFVILLALAVVGGQFQGFSKALNTILASSGIIALAISLAAQESLSNIIDGLFISMFKPFNIGDRVSLPEKNNLTGIVTEINLRHTVICTMQNSSFIVPNSVMSSAIIDNSNFRNETYAWPIDVSVAYDTDLELACRVMIEAVTSVPEFADPRTPEQIAAGAPMTEVLVREFGDSGISLRCRMFSHSAMESFIACSNARMAVKKAFDENHIVIPYNTVHIDNFDKIKDNSIEQ